MKLLDGIRVLAWQEAAAGALARFLGDLGATLLRHDSPLREADLESADLLLESLGLARIEETGMSRAQIEAANPRLVHVSVSTFGSHGPRRHWRGSELVASATRGILRLTGDVDRPPVKEALDACGFHADMVAADRDLRLAGYEVYRFGANELTGHGSAERIEAFFRRLLRKHAVLPGAGSAE